MTELELLLKGYRPTTAEILYHMPDYPDLLQRFIWQRLDLAPKFPVLCHFLDYWQSNLDGKLHSVRYAVASNLAPAQIRHAGLLVEFSGQRTLH